MYCIHPFILFIRRIVLTGTWIKVLLSFSYSFNIDTLVQIIDTYSFKN